ncbi:hypothetical protein [Nitratidesulfovibrio vulgaris]|nr:hypothetical protein [Nitratidesulfovibrio vulgaris]
MTVFRGTSNGTGNNGSTPLTSVAEGGNGSHSHGLDLRLAYVDIIIATKA